MHFKMERKTEQIYVITHTADGKQAFYKHLKYLYLHHQESIIMGIDTLYRYDFKNKNYTDKNCTISLVQLIR